jgi:hypothetical protein
MDQRDDDCKEKCTMSKSNLLALFLVGAEHRIFWSYVAAAWMCSSFLVLFSDANFYLIVVCGLALSLLALAFTRLYAPGQKTALTPVYIYVRRPRSAVPPTEQM